MGYELHLVKTRDWLDAQTNPLLKSEVEAMVAVDPELECYESDFQEANTSDTYETIRIDTPGYLFIKWNGVTRFWWKDGEIICKSPQPPELLKCIQMAKALGVYTVGDEGETYELVRGLFGKEKIVCMDPDGKRLPL